MGRTSARIAVTQDIDPGLPPLRPKRFAGWLWDDMSVSSQGEDVPLPDLLAWAEPWVRDGSLWRAEGPYLENLAESMARLGQQQPVIVQVQVTACPSSSRATIASPPPSGSAGHSCVWSIGGLVAVPCSGMLSPMDATAPTRPDWLRDAPPGVTEESFTEALADLMERKGQTSDRRGLYTTQDLRREFGIG